MQINFARYQRKWEHDSFYFHLILAAAKNFLTFSYFVNIFCHLKNFSDNEYWIKPGFKI